jgi:prepilin-type N-terminal cleavage/methylation domain-containing protein
MKQTRKQLWAFTLIELLVVIAIIAILAAILFPVFAQAKVAAKKAGCISNMKQWGLANQMYWGDFDDMVALWQYHYNFSVIAPQFDRDMGNLLYPYVKNMQMSVTPGSPIAYKPRITDVNFPNPTAMTGQAKEDQIIFNLGWLSDYGYNYQPLVGFFAGSGPAFPFGFGWNPQKATSVQNPGDTILNITGVFDRDASGGVLNGGQLPIDPPCRLWTDGTDTLAPTPYGATGRYYFGGWRPDLPLAWNVYGGVWPYYANKATTGFMDSHAKPLNIGAIAAGCNVLPLWGGQVTDNSIYIWDRF